MYKRQGTALIFIGVVLIGLMFYRQLPIDLYPNIDMNIVSVMTSYSGAGAEDVEMCIRDRDNSDIKQFDLQTDMARKGYEMQKLQFAPSLVSTFNYLYMSQNLSLIHIFQDGSCSSGCGVSTANRRGDRGGDRGGDSRYG